MLSDTHYFFQAEDLPNVLSVRRWVSICIELKTSIFLKQIGQRIEKTGCGFVDENLPELLFHRILVGTAIETLEANYLH